ncbi:hypothetical protein [Streptomyces sp. NPDC005423]|uniref:hypothetical protein n=1 Tax=Streptomyces sp. NPDC005423 TaxID=3155343 RepID=UPI0033B12BBB
MSAGGPQDGGRPDAGRTGGGTRHWNDETQRWETGGTTPQAPPPTTPPPPPRPDHVPPGTVPAWWSDGATAPVPEQPGPPVPWQPEGPAAPRPGPGRRLVWSVVAGAAAVGVAVSLVLTQVVGSGHDDEGKGRGPVSTGSTAAPTGHTDLSPSPTVSDASPSPSPSLPPLPAGYRVHDDEEGFRIAYPTGWKRSAVPSQYGIDIVNYRSADGSHRLQVYQVAEASPDASFTLYLSDATPRPPGFQEVELRNLDTADFTGSRLEYLADSLKGEPHIGTWHVYDERFAASDGTLYAIAAYGPDTDGGAAQLQLLTTALAWFCPQAGSCASAVD